MVNRHLYPISKLLDSITLILITILEGWWSCGKKGSGTSDTAAIAPTTELDPKEGPAPTLRCRKCWNNNFDVYLGKLVWNWWSNGH